MEPKVQYATTSDGVSIAWWAMGDGPPLVYLSGWPFEHAGQEWQFPDYRLLYEHLATHAMLVRFDGRGSGLSQRDVADISIEGRLRDLEAVVDRLGLDTFALCGFSTSSPLAITYAARHPERLTQLVLYDAWVTPAALASSPQGLAFMAMMRADWTSFTELLSSLGYGWSAGEPARRYARFLRQCVSQDEAIRIMDSLREIDVAELLPRIATPTMVLQHTEIPFPDVDMARRIAAAIPDATLALLEGNYGKEMAPERGRITQFLGAPDPVPQSGSLVTVLFTDIHESTRLTQRVGDVVAQDFVRTHNTVVREALGSHAGREIKHTGDGIMAAFGSATAALECSIAIQSALGRHNDSSAQPVRVRIGLNAGEPLAEDDDLFGTAVQLAARVCAYADPDQILVSDVVRQLVAGKEFLFADMGAVPLRGFDEPARLFEVRWREVA
jgi:class 3 adenylate cyclase